MRLLYFVGFITLIIVLSFIYKEMIEPIEMFNSELYNDFLGKASKKHGCPMFSEVLAPNLSIKSPSKAWCIKFSDNNEYNRDDTIHATINPKNVPKCPLNYIRSKPNKSINTDSKSWCVRDMDNL